MNAVPPVPAGLLLLQPAGQDADNRLLRHQCGRHGVLAHLWPVHGGPPPWGHAVRAYWGHIRPQQGAGVWHTGHGHRHCGHRVSSETVAREVAHPAGPSARRCCLHFPPIDPEMSCPLSLSVLPTYDTGSYSAGMASTVLMGIFKCTQASHVLVQRRPPRMLCRAVLGCPCLAPSLLCLLCLQAIVATSPPVPASLLIRAQQPHGPTCTTGPCTRGRVWRCNRLRVGDGER